MLGLFGIPWWFGFGVVALMADEDEQALAPAPLPSGVQQPPPPPPFEQVRPADPYAGFYPQPQRMPLPLPPPPLDTQAAPPPPPPRMPSPFEPPQPSNVPGMGPAGWPTVPEAYAAVGARLGLLGTAGMAQLLEHAKRYVWDTSGPTRDVAWGKTRAWRCENRRGQIAAAQLRDIAAELRIIPTRNETLIPFQFRTSYEETHGPDDPTGWVRKTLLDHIC